MSEDFSLLLASSVHDMKNSLGMLLMSLDELTTDMADMSDGQRRGRQGRRECGAADEDGESSQSNVHGSSLGGGWGDSGVGARRNARAAGIARGGRRADRFRTGRNAPLAR